MRVKRVRWYVCCEEERPIAQYQILDVFYWRPCIKKATLKDGLWTDASEPAFPGYLFIGSTKGWRYIETVLGEVQLIRAAGVPHELTERELTLARLFNEVQFNVAARNVREGQRVRVADSRPSAFTGLVGTVLQRVPVKGGEQVCVEFKLDRMVFSECVPLDHLEAVVR